jgi:hypothetical protein
VTHEVRDELAAGKTLDHLKAVLVAGGMLPDRDERLVELERWTSRIVASRDLFDDFHATDPRRHLRHRWPDTLNMATTDMPRLRTHSSR